MEKPKSSSPYGSTKFKSIDEYHQSFSGKHREMLDHIRAIINSALPDAIETISYNMPAFRLQKVVAYYAANKNHIGFYPSSTPILHFAEELRGFKTSKGAIQFPLDQLLPEAIIQKIIKFGAEQIKIKAIQQSMNRSKKSPANRPG